MEDNSEAANAAEKLCFLAKLVRLGDWSQTDSESVVNDAGESLMPIYNAAPESPTAMLIRGVCSHVGQFTVDGRVARLAAALSSRQNATGKGPTNLDHLMEIAGVRDLTPSYCQIAADAFESLAKELATRLGHPQQHNLRTLLLDCAACNRTAGLSVWNPLQDWANPQTRLRGSP